MEDEGSSAGSSDSESNRVSLKSDGSMSPPHNFSDEPVTFDPRFNLIKNPRAEDGLQGWEIVQNGGDGWVTENNRRTHPDDPVTKCFVTSFKLCLKQQLIDLKKEGYGDAFMDLQPPIRISDWCAPRADCGSEYQIHVELLDQRKKLIRSFKPEKVVFQQGNNEPWHQVTHVFKDYGPGVRFIRFTHGGKDTQFWKGWYGVRITNSSVEILPPAERFNLIKNPRAEDGLQGWKIVQNGGDGWVTENNRRTHPDDPVTKCFVTSFGLCLKQQLIDLKKEGYGDAFMDLQPPIRISDWCAPRADCGSEYQIHVELLDQRKKLIRSFKPEKVVFQQWNNEPWHQVTHVFKNYGPGVRFIRFTHGGKDTQFWEGWYGVRITNSSVKILRPAERFCVEFDK
ncbi:hypothetical protein ABG768_001366 [Culter alburnus]|uniref:FBA domain-containing protein n=1 Tax=Culter alburnus TaxID=194366 RepID=A0AAW2B967_CULAL